AVLMCDRILLFSNNPGRIIREIGVDLRHPRNRLDPQFRDLVEKIYVAMTQRTPNAAQSGAEKQITINTVLPRGSANLFSGLIEPVAGGPYNGKGDLAVLADELHMEGDELFPVAEAMQMFHFAEVEGGDIKLSDSGKQFAELGTDDRKKLFQRQLLQYIPL